MDGVSDQLGQHRIAAGVGSIAGAAVGTVVGFSGGPMGGVVGAFAGAIAGANAAEGLARFVDGFHPWAARVTKRGVR